MSNIHSFDKHFMPKLVVPPASQASANSAWELAFADSAVADRFLALVFWGAVGTSIISKVTQATDSGGTGAKDITGAVFAAAITAANRFGTIDLGPGALDNANGFKYVRVETTVVGTVVWGVITMRYSLRHTGRLTQDTTYAATIRVYD